MRTGFYAKLALTGMKKNKRFYLPYIMTCVLMVMMAYIVRFLAVTPVFAEMPGAASLQAMLSMGWGIITAFLSLLHQFVHHAPAAARIWAV